LSFEIQELPDVIKIVTLLNLHEKRRASKKALKEGIDVICTENVCIEPSDFEEALNEMKAEGLVTVNEFSEVGLTERGLMLGNEWNNLLHGDEPIMETVAGLTDGSITGLVVILSSYLTGLDSALTAFAALLTLASVALTNFSSFYLGGKTEDTRDLESLQRLINFSLSDIPDRVERSKSLTLISRLFTLLKRELNRSNLWSAVVSGVTTFLAGIVPIGLYMYLPEPLDMLLSLGFVGFVVVFFLVRYRARKMRLPLKVTFIETLVILIIVVAASLILGQRM
jgi:VIT1/CCC1 family predicted Fe2+/Mn2+ transporter